MRVRDVMSRDVETIDAGCASVLARELMRSRRIRHLVVLCGGRIAGVVSERDLDRVGADVPVGAVREVMTGDVVALPSAATLASAANLLRGRAIGCLPVIDGKRLVGIVTVSDLLDVMGRGGGHAHDRARPYVARRQGPPKKRSREHARM
jgi:acetoin utilization protein AcuB